MDDLALLVDLHKDAERQGPGGVAELKQALALAAVSDSTPLKIADIGCGTGASTLVLADSLNASVTAVDLLPEFLTVLSRRAELAGLSQQITTLRCDMCSLPFKETELDIICSEGAIYNIGFEHGVKTWKQFLKPGGLLLISEITWLTDTRPKDLQDFWEQHYPEIAPASEKIAVFERHGYVPLGYFVLPEHCWLDNYYDPMQSRFKEFLCRQDNSADAQEVVAAEQKEISFYQCCKDYYGYGFYIAKVPAE